MICVKRVAAKARTLRIMSDGTSLHPGSSLSCRPMSVTEALETRMTCRAFRDTPVSGDTVRSILSTAARAPSSGNLQPWRVWALTGDPLLKLEQHIVAKIAAGQLAEPPAEYLLYPENLEEPYLSRRAKAGEDMYRAIGIERNDPSGWIEQFKRNMSFFGAPVGLFFAIDRTFLQGQWADLGIFLQSVMLLARERGLDTAPLGAWSLWHRTVREMLGIPESHLLVCGMALGEMDDAHPINQVRTTRAPLEEFAVLQGFEPSA